MHESTATAHITLIAWATALSIHDIRHKTMPNRAVTAATASITITYTLAALKQQNPEMLTQSTQTALTYLAAAIILWLTHPEAIGAADIKITPALGFALGSANPTAAYTLTPLALAATTGITALAAKLRNTREMPYAPALFTAAITTQTVTVYTQQLTQ